MSITTTIIIENASFIAIFLLCLFGMSVCYKHSKTVPGVDLLLIGFLLYAIYGMLGWAIPGFTGSFMADWTRTAVVDSNSFSHFLAYGLRLGLIVLLIGLFRLGRNLKSQ